MISLSFTAKLRNFFELTLFLSNIQLTQAEINMDTIAIIEKCYKKDTKLYNILISHSTDVMNKAVSMAKKHPELNIDIDFVKEASMLHDIGIFLTHAPSIKCYGMHEYICHGYLGREILEKLGYPKHALVCERHTGTGLTLQQIISEDLPLPHREMMPVSIEEQIICFADCFYSKTRLGEEKSVERIRKNVFKHGRKSADQFDKWCEMFL